MLTTQKCGNTLSTFLHEVVKMKEINDFTLLNAISGGYERYVSNAEIIFECSRGTITIGLFIGLIGFAVTSPLGLPIAVTGAIVGTAAGFYLGYNIDQYCGLEPGIYPIVYY